MFVTVVLFEVLVVFKLVILVLLVMAVSLGLLSILPTTRPVLCHRNTCTEEGKHRCNHSNLNSFRFHSNLLSFEICPLGRKGSGNGLRKIYRTSVRRGMHSLTVWQKPTMWMRGVMAREGFNRHQITEHKGYEGRVKLKHRKVRFIQIPASPCAPVFRYHPNRDWLSHQWSIPDINTAAKVPKNQRVIPVSVNHPRERRKRMSGETQLFERRTIASL